MMVSGRGRQVDYFDILKRALSITWKNKSLWVLGFLVALVGGSNLSNTFEYQTGSQDTSRLGELAASYSIVILFVILILLGIGLLLWILSMIAIGGLVAAVDDIEKERPTSLGHAFSSGVHFFWRVLGLTIIMGIVVTALAFVFILPWVGGIVLLVSQGERAGGAATAGLFCLIPALVLFIFLLVLIGAFMGVFFNYAVRFAVIYNWRVFDSIRMAWRLIKHRKTETFLMFMLLLLTSAAFGLVAAIPGFIIGLPSLILLIGGVAANSAVIIALGAFGLFMAFIVFAVIRGIYEVFHSAAWTLTFLRLHPEAEPPQTP